VGFLRKWSILIVLWLCEHFSFSLQSLRVLVPNAESYPFDTVDGEDESSSLLHPGRTAARVSEKQTSIIKALLYAVQVFYSFFIM
jgi:hypothetical protein